MTRYPLLLLIITFTQGIYNYIPKINPASRYRRAPKEGGGGGCRFAVPNFWVEIKKKDYVYTII